jgi:hypothetical protein
VLEQLRRETLEDEPRVSLACPPFGRQADRAAGAPIRSGHVGRRQELEGEGRTTVAARREGPWSPRRDRESSRRTTGAYVAAPLVFDDRTGGIDVARIRSLTGDVPEPRGQESDAGDER